ncbi:FTR1 family iron permease [Peribacillus psychrosaccharolyticus]|uniref:FTR1 family iron permease n=1 Tax=Peribacillus psychrosaccharolyticus TaxID=1407 RepID=A0A974NJC4_PERPY|nr:FTR1 family protein [Peribacillus psychrosaccharolyticus]MEC2057839.1 FTR1 family iron permease [Peribacillus psychrosaccharolyticus]MED3744530.1 FTR1 family iron permease [Peribacillus psychrosaccharolyticus]QQS98657.1 FTR1 family iron permease [Peribacillus psychrosaccharolyticus]
MLVGKWKQFLGFMIIIGMVFSAIPLAVQAEDNHDELFIYIGDSLMKAKSGEKERIVSNMNEFEKEWQSTRKDSELAQVVDQQLLEVKHALKKEEDTQDLKPILSALSSAVIAYDLEQNPVDTSKHTDTVKQLLPFITELDQSIANQDFEKAKKDYQVLLNVWNKEVESIVREESVVSYGEIEKYMAFVRIGITQEPADQEKAVNNLDHLRTAIDNFLSGNVKKAEADSFTLSDVTELLQASGQALKNDEKSTAIQKLNEILTIWPMVEGDVSTRDSKLYSDMETQVPTAISLLESKKAKTEEAQTIIEDLHERMLPLISETSYSTWDAALILLREGLEALLIVATLLAFLKKVNQGDKQKWIWAGVVAGLLASAILAIVINIVFSKITAASSREYIEGITGIAAVVMMVSVGAWLHSKANIKSWNRYINKQMTQAITTGSVISFAMVSFLSIFREGAETIIFYAGMSPYMSLQQLVTGIVLALVILIVAGVLIMRYSVKIPISVFFKAATVFIYLLAFKILGVSVHALQVSKTISIHTLHSFPFIDWIGLYPTVETLLPQLVLLLIILFTGMTIKKRNQTA